MDRVGIGLHPQNWLLLWCSNIGLVSLHPRNFRGGYFGFRLLDEVLEVSHLLIASMVLKALECCFTVGYRLHELVCWGDLGICDGLVLDLYCV